jgi:hypothetical protein
MVGELHCDRPLHRQWRLSSVFLHRNTTMVEVLMTNSDIRVLQMDEAYILRRGPGYLGLYRHAEGK